jgi:hypothetical protein
MDENNPNQDPKPNDLRAAYDEAIRAFTLDDLQKYETPEEGFPLEDIIAEMEAIQRRQNDQRAGQ